MTTPRISVIVGSLRRGSFARKIAHEVLTMIPENYQADIVEIRDLPLYDFDYDDPSVTDKPIPAEYTTFRDTIKNSSGVLFVTPENNRTIPACLKNAVDIGSKPNSDVAWKNLPAGIISHSEAAWAATVHRRTSGSPCPTSICRFLVSPRYSLANPPPSSKTPAISMKAPQALSKTTLYASCSWST